MKKVIFLVVGVLVFGVVSLATAGCNFNQQHGVWVGNCEKVTPVPEPTILILLVVGLASLALVGIIRGKLTIQKEKE